VRTFPRPPTSSRSSSRSSIQSRLVRARAKRAFARRNSAQRWAGTCVDWTADWTCCTSCSRCRQASSQPRCGATLKSIKFAQSRCDDMNEGVLLIARASLDQRHPWVNKFYKLRLLQIRVRTHTIYIATSQPTKYANQYEFIWRMIPFPQCLLACANNGGTGLHEQNMGHMPHCKMLC
jgi:hypothetical protein